VKEVRHRGDSFVSPWSKIDISIAVYIFSHRLWQYHLAFTFFNNGTDFDVTLAYEKQLLKKTDGCFGL
jgi:hypothetical protein